VSPAFKLHATVVAPAAKDRTVGELFGELATEMSTLVRQEVKLATTEATQKAAFVLRQSITIAIGALVAQVAAVILGASLALGLGEFMPLWLSALLVGVLFAGAAATVISTGLHALRQLDPAPKQTLESFADNARWAQEQIR
jgi:hypothetical protein